MGKVRKTKARKVKNAVVSEESNEEEQLSNDSKENAVQTILDQLQVSFITTCVYQIAHVKRFLKIPKFLSTTPITLLYI